MRSALETVVVFRTNSHDGDAGHALAEKYEAHGLPHFVLMDSSGAPLDRWVGYRNPGEWLRTFESATSDLTTVEAKEERFKSAPTEALAAALGRVHGSLSLTKDSVADYRAAEKLAGGPKPDYTMAIFFEVTRGFTTGQFTIDDVRAAADAAMSLTGVDPVDKLVVASSMADIAKDKKDPALFARYLERAIEVSEGSTDDRAKQLRADLEIAGALLVQGNKDQALTLKKKSMPPGWEQNAESLNNFAWWCFENQVDLEEAERLARKGAELAKPGAGRAEILDTAAEICNLLGNCNDAVSLAEQAVKEDPKTAHYTEQVKRFAENRDKKAVNPSSG